MANVTWEFTVPLKDEGSIKAFCQQYSVTLPEDFIQTVKDHNQAYPKPHRFDSDKAKEHVAQNLLSFNEDDRSNIFKTMRIMRGDQFYPSNLVPFANDPFGNILCFEMNGSDSKVVFWNHEEGKTEFIANSFSEFLNKLY